MKLNYTRLLKTKLIEKKIFAYKSVNLKIENRAKMGIFLKNLFRLMV